MCQQVTECRDVPRQVCTTFPRTVCKKVPQKQCRDVQQTVCDNMIVSQDCSGPKGNCREETRQSCQQASDSFLCDSYKDNT